MWGMYLVFDRVSVAGPVSHRGEVHLPLFHKLGASFARTPRTYGSVILSISVSQSTTRSTQKHRIMFKMSHFVSVYRNISKASKGWWQPPSSSTATRSSRASRNIYMAAAVKLMKSIQRWILSCISYRKLYFRIFETTRSDYRWFIRLNFDSENGAREATILAEIWTAGSCQQQLEHVWDSENF